MRNFTYPQSDASIYREFPTRNTGLDEILEVGTTSNGTQAVRSLIQFDITNLSASVAIGDVNPSSQFELILYIANATDLNAGQMIEGKIVSQSWIEGTGYFYQEVLQAADGVTWKNAKSGSLWAITGSTTSSVGAISQSASRPMTDFSFDMTSTVRNWISGSVPNNGMIFKFPDFDEVDPTNMGNFKFFSKDTHTVYRPTLVAKWNDQIWNTGSLQLSPSHSLLAVPGNVKESYQKNEVVRVDIYVRERYPLKRADNIFTTYDGNRALPTSSYYSIVDEQTGNVIIPFDDFSRVSVDPAGSYMTFKVQNMFPQRYYRVLLKVVHDGLSEVFDNNIIFTVRQ